MDTRRFLSTVFGNKPKESFVNIYILPQRQSNFFKDIDKAADFVESIHDKPNFTHIYVACGIHDQIPQTGRGKRKNIIAIPGLFMDIDVSTSPRAHKKTTLPKTMNAAISIVESFVIKPTLIINSGYGIHVWWLLKEPWILPDDNARHEADMLNARLQATIKAIAMEKEYRLDSTWDISRILRPPGTYNRKKPEDPKMVEVMVNTGIFFEDFEKLENYLISQEEMNLKINPSNEERVRISDNLVLSSNADPPFEKFQDLMEIFPDLRTTWNGERTDFVKCTASEHAMSLANMAVKAGWSDQEIADMIVAFYRKHHGNKNLAGGGKPPNAAKGMRADYISMTIAKARHAFDEQVIQEYVENQAEMTSDKYRKILDPDGKKAETFLKKILGFDIKKIIKWIQEDKITYTMKTDFIRNDGHTLEINFENPKVLMNKSDFIMTIFSGTNIILKLDNKQFLAIRTRLSELIFDIQVGANTVDMRMRDWLEEYLSGKMHITMEESLTNHEPFVHDGSWYIFPDHFRSWAYIVYGDVNNINRVNLDITRIGGQKKRLDPINPATGKRKKIFPYRIPPNVICPVVEEINFNEQESA